MSNTSLVNFGYAIIETDLKRLKNYKSLKEDLDKIFSIVNKPWMEFGKIIDEQRMIYQETDIICYKRRGPVSSHGLSPASGIRLIYAIVKKSTFIPLLLFLASEEAKYPLRICKDIVKKRICDFDDVITNSSQ